MSKNTLIDKQLIKMWQRVFFNNVGAYINIINTHLARNYKQEPLFKHLKIQGGYAFKNSEYQNTGIPIIRISDFQNEEIVLKNAVFYREDPSLEKYLLNEGDIIIALTGGTIAKLAIVQGQLGKLYLNQRVGKFVAINPEEFVIEYIYWLARGIQDKIKNLAWGAAIPNVSPKDIEKMEYPIPSLTIQSGIIDFLNSLKNNTIDNSRLYFDKCTEQRILSLQIQLSKIEFLTFSTGKQLDYVKQLRQAFLREAMQGKLVPQDENDEPASVLLEKIKAEKAQLIAEGKLKKEKPLPPIKPEEIPYEIPKNWVWCRFKEIGTFTGGGTPSMANTSYWDGGIPWFSPKDIKAESVNDSEMTLSNEGVQNSSAKLIPAGSILVVGRSGILRRKLPVAINSKICTVNQDIKVFLPLSLVNICFIQKMLLGLESIILRDFVKFGMTVHSLKYTDFENMVIPFPPINEQTRIIEKLSQVSESIISLEVNTVNSQNYTSQLLQATLREALTDSNNI